MIDINIKYKEHPRFVDGEIEINGDLEQLLQQIELISFTSPGEVIGEEDFGYNLEDNLFNINVQPDQIAETLRQKIYEEIPDAARYTISVTGELVNLVSDAVGIISIEVIDPSNETNSAKIEALISK